MNVLTRLLSVDSPRSDIFPQTSTGNQISSSQTGRAVSWIDTHTSTTTEEVAMFFNRISRNYLVVQQEDKETAKILAHGYLEILNNELNFGIENFNYFAVQGVKSVKITSEGEYEIVFEGNNTKEPSCKIHPAQFEKAKRKLQHAHDVYEQIKIKTDSVKKYYNAETYFSHGFAIQVINQSADGTYRIICIDKQQQILYKTTWTKDEFEVWENALKEKKFPENKYLLGGQQNSLVLCDLEITRENLLEIKTLQTKDTKELQKEYGPLQQDLLELRNLFKLSLSSNIRKHTEECLEILRELGVRISEIYRIGMFQSQAVFFHHKRLENSIKKLDCELQQNFLDEYTRDRYKSFAMELGFNPNKSHILFVGYIQKSNDEEGNMSPREKKESAIKLFTVVSDQKVSLMELTNIKKEKYYTYSDPKDKNQLIYFELRESIVTQDTRDGTWYIEKLNVDGDPMKIGAPLTFDELLAFITGCMETQPVPPPSLIDLNSYTQEYTRDVYSHIEPDSDRYLLLMSDSATQNAMINEQQQPSFLSVTENPEPEQKTKE